MKILEVYTDGSRTVLYEDGDRVYFPKDYRSGFLGAKAGEVATVIRRKASPDGWRSTAFLEIQTDSMKVGGYGVLTVPPWVIRIVEDVTATRGED